MRKFSFVLIPFLILFAKALNNVTKVYHIPVQKQISIYQEPPVPIVNNEVIPVIKQEVQRVFNPVIYGNASRIEFSNGISFDTRILGKSGEPYLPAGMEYKKEESDYYIVQFTGPLYSNQKDWLSNKGIGIHFYIPHYGFVCTIEDINDLDQVRAHPTVTWVGMYQPAYKVSSLFDRVSQQHKITILLFMDADMNEVLTEVELITNSRQFEVSDNGINKIIQGTVNKSDVNVLARIPGIYWIEPYIQPVMHNDNVQWIVQDAQYNFRNIWNKGIRGEGEILNNTDSGINTSHYMHRSGSAAISTWGYYPSHNAIVAYDSGAGSSIVFGDGSGASWHGTHTCGTMAGNDSPHASSPRDGVAMNARIYFNDCGNNTSDTIFTYSDLNDLYIKSYSRYYPPTRAHVSSNSWGSAAAGAYTTTCLTSDQFMWQHKDFLLCFSNGNSGPGAYSVGAPASAKNVVSVGGVVNGSGTQYTLIYGWGSRGPCVDGRQKPTILTPAQNVYSSTSGSSTYGSLSGTSMACPSAAGAAGLIRQYLREGWYPTGRKTVADSFSFISASLLKAILVNSADPNVGSYTVPDNNIGWGRVDLDSTLYFAGDARKTLLIDNTPGILTGEQVDYHFSVPALAGNLKIAVVWTDYPGNPAVMTQIVNDLDLVVTVGGTYYNGNQYSGGESVANPAGRDSLNVVECVRRANPTAGDYKVSILGRNVPYGPQPFSLVISYSASSVAGIVSLDKPVYRANDFVVDTVQVRVEDTNYGSALVIDSVRVVFQGDLTETQPETLWCYELAESSYVFKGEFILLFHKPVHGDGELSVSQDDTIRISYTDVSPSFISTTWAGVDASYFLISGVHCETIEATSAEVCWTTNDNANSTVYYGTNPVDLDQVVSVDTPYCTPHRLRVSGLGNKTIYYYDVESSDFRGNKVIDNNGGQHYSFTTKPGGSGIDVMVVVLNSDGYDDAFEHANFLTDALDYGGWTYNWWQTKSDGDFSRDMLKQYKAVYFQVGQTGGSGGNYPVWTVAQKETMKVYHNGGARFAMTGFDIGWDPWENSPSADTLFCKNYLHFRYIGDITLTSWNTLYGMSLDPISGLYTGGVIYHPFRDGAAGDSIRLSGTGASGTGSYVWHGEEANDSCAIKWESTSDMGSSGNGVWGGHKTRVVTNAFEITQIDTTDPNSVIRANILNNMFIWLIGHDHPDVTLSSPQGGQTYVSSPLSIEWTSSAYGSAIIDTTWLEYSPDQGQTWVEIASGQNVTSPYSWDIGSLTNGPNYIVRITVCDGNIYPSMKGSNQTTNFTINIPGNDYIGPKVLPQSIVVQTNPKIVTPTDTLLPITAIISDSLTGLSDISLAQWRISGFGTYPMYPDDGAWDEIQEMANSAIRFSYIPGNTDVCTLWVRGRDNAPTEDPNWGEWVYRTFTLIDGVPVGIGIDEGFDIIPLAYAFSSPAPNPFVKNTKITYALPHPRKVSLKIYNCLGQVVRVLIDGKKEPGIYSLSWDGRDELNRRLGSGIYFIKYSTDEFTKIKKIVMIK
ncbi:MAG: S8 family serine peptidase [bacterium]